MTAEHLIAALGLAPLSVEGGWYRETYRSTTAWPSGKSASTAIYYLLTPDTFSALHRLPTDEIYHFYAGDPVELLLLGPEDAQVVLLGADVPAGQVPQVVVPAGTWQGSWLRPGGRFALLGTTMAPGFDFADYQPGQRDELRAQYPAWHEWIDRLCR
jgi:predicted cupin superfamily sugar epimerase